MKKLILILIAAPFFCFSQKDTVYIKDKGAVPGTITTINTKRLFYFDANKKKKGVDKKDVVYCYYNGARLSNEDINKESFAYKREEIPDTVNISAELDYMKDCFQKYNLQYKTGRIIALTGAIGTGLFSYLSYKEPNNWDMFTGASAVVFLTGAVITIDASKWIKRAGLGVNKNGLGVVYRFK